MAEHGKGCSCDHSHDKEGIDEAIASDVASKSLSDALQISFTILKIIMAVLVVLFIASGVFEVDQGEQALVLHFGKIRGDTTEERVLTSGLHWAWPAPIDEIIKIPVTQKQVLNVDSAWYYMTDAEKANPALLRPPSPDLDPERDGYCLTRSESSHGKSTDYSIVHSKWKLTYTIVDVEKFFKNIYYNSPRPGEDFLDVMGETVNPLLTALTDDAVVSTMVEYTIDEATEHSIAISQSVAKRLQAKLEKIDSGIIVENVQPQRITWPRQVNEVFEASNKASQESRRLVTEAKSYAEQKLNQTGGVNAEMVLEKLLNGPVHPEEKERLLSLLAGEAQSEISKARADRTEIVETAKANAEYLHDILDAYRRNPEFVLQSIYQQLVSSVMNNADEKYFADPGGEIRVMINPDPKTKKRRMTEEKEKSEEGDSSK